MTNVSALAKVAWDATTTPVKAKVAGTIPTASAGAVMATVAYVEVSTAAYVTLPRVS